MTSEETIYCDMAFKDPSTLCRFQLVKNVYGDSTSLTAVCSEHDGGEVMITLVVLGAISEAALQKKRMRARPK